MKKLIVLLFFVLLVSCESPSSTSESSNLENSDFLSPLWHDYVVEDDTRLYYYIEGELSGAPLYQVDGEPNKVSSPLTTDNIAPVAKDMELLRIVFTVEEHVGIDFSYTYPKEYTKFGVDNSGYRSLVIDMTKIRDENLAFNFGDELMRINFTNGASKKEFILCL